MFGHTWEGRAMFGHTWEGGAMFGHTWEGGAMFGHTWEEGELAFTRRRCESRLVLACDPAAALQGEARAAGVVDDIAVGRPVWGDPGVMAVLDLTGQVASYS